MRQSSSECGKIVGVKHRAFTILAAFAMPLLIAACHGPVKESADKPVAVAEMPNPMRDERVDAREIVFIECSKLRRIALGGCDLKLFVHCAFKEFQGTLRTARF